MKKLLRGGLRQAPSSVLLLLVLCSESVLAQRTLGPQVLQEKKTQVPYNAAQQWASGPPTASSGWNGAFIWRGFNHLWTYNHRLNRIGDIVREGSCETTPDVLSCESSVAHTGASGTGPDDLQWDSYYTFVGAQNVDFEHTVIKLRLSGKERDLLSDSQQVTIRTSRGVNIAILRGFDLVSNEKADQLDDLRIAVSSDEFDPATGEFTFTIEAQARLACRTPECNTFVQTVDYDLRVFTTVVSGSSESLNHAQTSISNEYEWPAYQGNPDNELKRISKKVTDQSIQGIGGGQFKGAALAFRTLDIDLNRDQHLLELDLVILPEIYSSNSGKYDFELRLFFKQWNAAGDGNRWEQSPEGLNFADFLDTFADLVIEHEGDARITAEVALLQFANGYTKQGKVGGSFHWAGGNEKADSPAARRSVDIVESLNLSAVDPAAEPEYTLCQGAPVDPSKLGTDGDDHLVGKNTDEVFHGLGGHDVIDGGGGDDIICGGEGDDVIRGREGKDTIRGGPGNDVLFGGNDGDTLHGGDGDDTLIGGSGEDNLHGDANQDICVDAFAEVAASSNCNP